LGRVTIPEVLAEDVSLHGIADSVRFAAPNPIDMDKDHPVSEESTEKEIQLPVRDFAKAASRAVFEALFDGVEVLGVMIICLTNSVNMSVIGVQMVTTVALKISPDLF
jgi:NADPH2 dehydrogenase